VKLDLYNFAKLLEYSVEEKCLVTHGQLNALSDPYLSTREAKGCTTREVPITISRSHLGISYESREQRLSRIRDINDSYVLHD